MINVQEIAAADVEPLLAPMAADGLDVIEGVGSWIGVLDDAGPPLGVARTFECGGYAVVDDVWVAPPQRRRGLATALIARAAAMHRPIWLICDEPDVAFYAARGFVQIESESFPAPLAAHYAAKHEWPSAPDHDHVAMRMASLSPRAKPSARRARSGCAARR